MGTERFVALYVEDNALDADLTRRALLASTPPIEVDAVDTIAAAMQRLDADASRYTWAMVDLTLPDGDGLQLLRRIRQLHLPLAVIAVSGTGTEASVFRALKSGVDDYVVKVGDYLHVLADSLFAVHERLRARAERLAAPARVLYIEDSAMEGELARRHLAHHAPHLQIDIVDRLAPAAVDRLLAGGYDVLLLDYRLDDLDAFELVKRVRREGPRALPIVMVTAYGSEDVAVQALRLGVDDYVAKGIDHLGKLPMVLDAAIARAHVLRERERLRESEARLRRVTEHVPGVITVTRYDADGSARATETSRPLDDMLGLTPRGLDDGTLFERVDPADRDALRDALAGAIATRQRRGCEFRIDVPGKGQRWIEWQLSAEAQPDGGVLAYGYLFDTTERHRMQQLAVTARAAEQASRAKTDFLSRMSHELRTPLNAVVGFTQLLESDRNNPLTETQRRWVDHIHRAAQHLVAMIGEVLDLSRIESDQVSMRLEAVDLAEACDDALKLALPVNEKQVAVSVEMPADGLPCFVQADRLRLVQVLANLLSNASKYNRVGGTVSVRAQREGERMAIDIADTGVGLSDEQMLHLFEPFNRLGAEGSSIAGTGMGLVIVKRLVELMAGSLAVASRVGVGSHFTVRLPVATAPLGAPDRVPLPAADAGPAGRVLYIEDNPVNVELVRYAVELRDDIVLQIATTGAEGLRSAAEQPPDLVLLDMHLPDMDGFEIFEALNRLPALAGVPCVALSADALPEQIQRTLLAGFDEYLTKPIDLYELVEVMLRWLKRRAAAAASPATGDRVR